MKVTVERLELVVIGLPESLKLDSGKNPRMNATVPIVESKSDLVSFVVSGLAGRLFLCIFGFYASYDIDLRQPLGLNSRKVGPPRSILECAP